MASHHIRLLTKGGGGGGGGISGRLGSPGRVGSVFDERCDDELVALPRSNMKGRVSVLVLTIDVSSYPPNKRAITCCTQQLQRILNKNLKNAH